MIGEQLWRPVLLARAQGVETKFGSERARRTFTVLLTALAVLVAPRAFADEECKLGRLGLGLEYENNSGGGFLGESPGQTFFAPETALKSLTVWRIASQDTHFLGLVLRITPTDTLGVPIVNEVLYEGPVIRNFYGDGVNPTPFRWEFEPPMLLPGVGLYAFFISPNHCSPGVFNLSARYPGGDTYPQGTVWLTQRSLSAGCPLLGPAWNSEPDGDFCFDIEYCSSLTPARRSSWGDLKVRYR